MREKDADFYDNMGDDVDHPSVDPELVNDSSRHRPKSGIELADDTGGEQGKGSASDEKKQQLRKQAEAHQYEMAEEFDVDSETSAQKHPKAYVEGCDMGWC
ncbi:hypothetical protein SAMN05421736_1248 [Evansella caseinilytica]|uniref:Uncharacterized protein n=1 Tax=Evansella caseinilytica TaxID=1503961 RepID=A0A1H3UQI0_9BACI|nr:hypothetical protein [Evansella caseinilytica]SDZ64145.1 hypothetical protein SAMN05421736_1248 [Evansella caseinilytica]